MVHIFLETFFNLTKGLKYLVMKTTISCFQFDEKDEPGIEPFLVKG